MSRVYEALRRSASEKGVTTPALSDPDTFLLPAAPDEPVMDARSTGMEWDEIKSLLPAVREESRVVTLTAGNSLGAEKFRVLRARLRNLRERRQLQKLVITSAVSGEGKTLMAMNLAVCLAKNTREKVLLLEGDLRKPVLSEYLGIEALNGIGEWASVDEPASRFIYRLDDLQLWILPAGSPSENPANTLQSSRFAELYKRLSACFDWIIIDAPPLLPTADISFWSLHADGLLLVVREGKTSKAALQKGLETLDNPKVIGVVLNDAREAESGYYSPDYRRGQKHSSERK